MKKISLIFLTLIVAISCFVVACKNNNVGYNALTFESSNLTLVTGFEEEIKYSYQGQESIIWSSSDNNVATVNNGVVTGVSAGNATVSAEVEGQSVKCDVSVVSFDSTQLRLVLDNSDLELYSGQDLALNCKLYYGERLLDGYTVNYSTSNDQILQLNNNVVTATSVGNASIFATTKYNGFDVNTVININVVSALEISIQESAVEVFAVDSYAGTDYAKTQQLTATVKENGAVVDNAQIIWSSENNGICEISQSGLINGVSVGNTIITATYSTNNETVTDSIYVEVKPVEIEIELNEKDIDLSVPYEIDFSQYVTGVQNVLEVRVSDGKFEDLASYSSGKLYFDEILFVGENTVVVSTDKLEISFDVYLWSKFISDVSDFESLYNATYGHYKLLDDIDLLGVEWKYKNTNTKFTGLLNGNGKTISNFNVSKNGIFNTLADGATIKDLTIKDVVIIDDANDLGVLCNNVASNSTVTVEGVTAEIINKGTNCGGLFGYSESNSTIIFKDIKTYTYSDGEDVSRGAVIGSSSGGVQNQGNVIIYSSMSACCTESTAKNTTYQAFNTTVASVGPEKYDKTNNELINSSDSEDYLFDFSTLGNVSNIMVYSNVKKSHSATTISIVKEEYQNIFDGGIEVLVKLAGGSYEYFIINTFTEVHITQDNVEMLKTVRKGKIVLDEDITIGKWQAHDGAFVNGTFVINETYDFAGEFDGQGHTINGLEFKNAGSGIFYRLSGTVKNVTVLGVKLNQGNTAVFACQQGSGDLTFENVYISVDSYIAAGYQGALVERNTTAGYKTIVNNVYVEMAVIQKDAERYTGFVSGYQNNNLAMENCVFVGGAGTVTPLIKVTAKNGFNYFESVDNLNQAIQSQEFSFSSQFIKNQYDKINGVLIITKNNIDLLKDETLMSTTKNIVLGEDIDMHVSGQRTVWTNTAIFSGTFDGKGFTISGLEFKSTSGLFKKFAGTIKNLALVDIKLNGGNTASIAYVCSDYTVVDNVFVQIADMTTSDAWRGGLFERGGGNKTIKNTVVVFEVETNPVHCGYLAGHNGGAMTLENVYMIGTGNRGIKPTNSLSGGSVASNSSNYEILTKEVFTQSSNLVLTSQMQTWVLKYL